MATTSEYLNQLKTDKENLINAFNERSVSVSADATFTDLATASSSLPTGGGSTDDNETIEFYDYDGTKLYTWKLSELADKTELPTPPSHDGLTFDEWNWTLEELQAENKPTDVGATYVTDDGKTRLYVNIPIDNFTLYFQYYQKNNSSFTIDWGDGSAVETSSSSLNIGYANHTYTTSGDYVIKLTSLYLVDENYYFSTYNANSGYSPFSNSTSFSASNAYIGKQILRKAETGVNFSINTGTFSNCLLLETVAVYKKLFNPRYSNIGKYIFENCYSLKALVIPKTTTSISLTYNLLTSPYSLNKIILPSTCASLDTTSISNSLVERLTVPKSITNNYPTNSGKSLKYLSLDKDSTTLKPNLDCWKLKNAIIPSKVTSLVNNQFRYCYSLEELTNYANLTSIGEYAFQYTPITSFEFQDTLKTIGLYAFYSTRLEEAILPSSVTSIGNYAFGLNLSLKKIKFPENITSIPQYVCINDYILEEVILPTNCTTIGSNAFNGCSCLHKIELPETITTINTASFQNSGLTSIKIPSGVSTIQTYTFYACYACQCYDFTSHTSIPTLAGTNAFTGINGKIVVPDDLYDDWIVASNWSTYASKIVKASEYSVS